MDLLRRNSEPDRQQAREKGFALPTVLILSIVLLAIGVSTLQVGAAISRSLVDQHWNRLAKVSGQSGVEVVSSCTAKGFPTWPVTLKPNLNCDGSAVTPARDIYIASDTSASASPSKWRTTYTIEPPTTGSDLVKRVKVNGKVEILTPDNTTVKTYNWYYNVILNYSFKKAIQIETSGTHTCAITSDQLVFCSGLNTNGRLGDATNNGSWSTPVRFKLPDPISATAMDVALTHTCALTSDQSVYCAGKNTYGQRGDQTTADNSTPQKFILPAGKIAIALNGKSDDHTCALTNDQLVYCAGRNNYGQLGNGTTANTNTSLVLPFNLPGGKKAAQVTTSTDTICVLTSDQFVYCAGRNDYGQLGNGTTANTNTSVLLPFILPAGKAAARVIPSTEHTCVLTTDRLVYCAGRNNLGQLGDATAVVSYSTPQLYKVPSSKLVMILSVFSDTSCVLTIDQLVYCAGKNANGQFGNGNTTSNSTPQPFNLSGKFAKDITVAANVVCAVTTDQSLLCAGQNNVGQLSFPTLTDRTTPVLFDLPTGKTAAEAHSSSNTTCVTATDQTAYCAGDNTNGQLGDASTINRSEAVMFLLQ